MRSICHKAWIWTKPATYGLLDTGNHRIQEFGPDGNVLFVAGKQGSGPDEFKNPTGIACRGDKICVADNGNGRIQVLARPKS